MTKSITVTTTLLYYDGILLFDATDAIGGKYVGSLIGDQSDAIDRYLVVGVSPEALQSFRLGYVDLLSLIENRPEQEWFTVDVDSGFSQPISLQVCGGPIPDLYLPSPGFSLAGEVTYAQDAEVRDQALAKQRTVMELALESVESAAGHVIRAAKLGGLLLHVQNLLRHAYAKKMELLNAIRSSAERADAPLLDVIVPAAPGSFRVVLAASQSPNLWGGGEITYALDVMDDIMSVPDDPQETLERLRKYRGRTVGSYLGLLKFIAENNISMRYAWAEPSRTDVSAHRITRKQAEPLVFALEAEEALSIEKVELTGKLYEGDSKAGEWHLEADDGKTYHGKVREHVSVHGRELGARHKFVCEEVEEMTGTGRIKRTLYAIEITPLD